MGKIRTKTLGTTEETEQKEKAKVKREQKKLRFASPKPTGEGGEQKPEPEIKSETVLEKPVSTSPKPTHMRSKKYKEVSKDFDKTKTYPLSEAIELVKKLNYAKFDATFEAHLVMTEKDQKATLTYPHSTGKSVKIMAFVSADKEKEALAAGADYVADNETIAKIEKGEVEFQAVVATPDWMPKLGKLAKILGPKGLMPNPKAGNITPQPGSVIKALKGGQITVKTEAEAPLIHTVVGKVSFKTEDLEDNLKALVNAIGPTKIVSLTLKSTMSPGIKLQLSAPNDFPPVRKG